MEDYVPFMDKHPELKLKPTTDVDNIIRISNFSRKYDYIQDLNRKGENGKNESFHLIVIVGTNGDKDTKFGILYHRMGSLSDCVALPALYESIEFLYKKEKAFAVIMKCNGKYGLFFWEYNFFVNKTYTVAAEYESMEVLSNKRIKGIKNGKVIYFDKTGHVLK